MFNSFSFTFSMNNRAGHRLACAGSPERLACCWRQNGRPAGSNATGSMHLLARSCRLMSNAKPRSSVMTDVTLFNVS